MKLSKFTAEYVATADPETLNADRKALLGLKRELDALLMALKERLVAENEAARALRDFNALPPHRRAAIERAIKHANN